MSRPKNLAEDLFSPQNQRFGEAVEGEPDGWQRKGENA
jgi:hypothetical protein